MKIAAIFGPTASGKTGVAIELAELLRERGEDPVAVSCDAMQVYRGMEAISAAPAPAEQERLEHRLVGIAAPGEEFSAGRYAELAHREIDALLAEARRPILVGGTGLYLQAALTDLDLKPPVPEEIRAEVERDLEARGPQRLHEELPEDERERVHPNDRKRIARLHELRRAGLEPHAGAEGMWEAEMRRPAAIFGLELPRDVLVERIRLRAVRMAEAGAVEEARALLAVPLSRTAASIKGLEELAAGDTGALEAAHARYARRQATWMRKIGGLTPIQRDGRGDRELAAEIRDRLLG